MISNDSTTPQTFTANRHPFHFTRTLTEGICAGMVGAATIAVWFFILDTIAGRPLYTPSLLGSILFDAGLSNGALTSDAISGQMVVAFTLVHGLVFTALGLTISWLLTLAERYPFTGIAFLVPFLFFIFEFGFVITALVFRELLIQAIGWERVLIGNGLAAVAMCQRHRKIME